jgi:hypothetical protein
MVPSPVLTTLLYCVYPVDKRTGRGGRWAVELSASVESRRGKSCCYDTADVQVLVMTPTLFKR